MKKLLLFIVIMSCGKIFSQEESLSKSEKVHKIYNTPHLKEMYSFRQKFSEVFDMDKVNGKGTVKSEVTFVVTSEGKITNIKTTGTNVSMNSEMERAINEMNKFKLIPKKLNCKPIDSTYNLPVEITFVKD